QRGVAGEAVQAGGVVVVEPRQLGNQAGRGQGVSGAVDGVQSGGGVAGVGVHLGLDCRQPGCDRATGLGSEVIGGAVEVVQCCAEAVFCGGDERDVRERGG